MLTSFVALRTYEGKGPDGVLSLVTFVDPL